MLWSHGHPMGRARVDMLALVAQLDALALKVQSIQTSRAGRLLRLGS